MGPVLLRRPAWRPITALALITALSGAVQAKEMQDWQLRRFLLFRTDKWSCHMLTPPREFHDLDGLGRKPTP